eukprot:1157919-Pelagomonas_calceolata.AAC.8
MAVQTAHAYVLLHASTFSLASGILCCRGGSPESLGPSAAAMLSEKGFPSQVGAGTHSTHSTAEQQGCFCSFWAVPQTCDSSPVRGCCSSRLHPSDMAMHVIWKDAAAWRKRHSNLALQRSLRSHHCCRMPCNVKHNHCNSAP